MGLYPKASGDLQGIDPEIFPPGLLVARLMQLPVMTPTERHREFIADLQAERPWLGKAQMMRIRRLSSADQTWLAGNKFQMSLVAQPFRFGDRQLTFVDRGRQ